MVNMAMVEDRSLFENEEWVVGENGLEHKRTGYFIGRDVLSQRRADGLWLWPLHVAEKNWCRMAPFIEAFSCAASVYGIRSDTASNLDLARSFMTARREVAEWPRPDLRREASLARAADHASRVPAARTPSLPRPHAARGSARASLAPWRAPRIRQAGTTIARLLRAAWNKK
jgi:hypothetical protein